jgi:energy-coupling factor transporter ATP-binding protein EcfA2
MPIPNEIKLLVASSCVLGSYFFPPLLAIAGIASDEKIMQTINSVAISVGSNAFDALIGKEGFTSLENHDLTKAVGRAIATVIRREAKSTEDKAIKRKLNHIAQQAEEGWLKIFQGELGQQNYQELREAKLDQFLTPNDLKLTQRGNLSVEDWKNIFCRLNMYAQSGGGCPLPTEIYERMGQSLHDNFPHALREVLKSDFRADGKAYAGFILQLLTETKARVAELQAVNEQMWGKVLPALESIEARIRGTEGEQRKFFEELVKIIQSPPKLTNEEWHSICQDMLDERLALTTNLFTNQSGVIIEVKDVYTPLALVIKTKPDSEKKPEPSKQCQQGASQENGANQSQQEILQPISEDDFLEKLKSKTTEKSQGRRIAIIGEPGSGKTTRLQMLANWILKEQMGLPIWVSLADLGERSLPEYLEQRWLQSCGKQKYWEDLQKQIDSGNVWLLLDGLDEWTQQVGNLVHERLLTGAIGKARMVITCRSNVWDGEINALSGFDVFRNREFEPEQVKEYIGKWFQTAGKPDGGERLLTKLEEPGKDRLRDLIRNPLRLSLLCATWYQTEEELPRTKAGLYQQFVKQIYRWKSDSLSTNLQEREEINQTLAHLAWEGIQAEEKGNTSRFRLREGMVLKCLGKYFKKVLALGWINRIGEEKKADNTIEQVYAFYHATFQEYFAALYVPEWRDEQNRIPGWDYFVPCDHRGKPVPNKTYRVFYPRWKEVILFWLGRNDVSIDAKKAFLGVNSATGLARMIGIKSLRDSGDGCGNFYGLQARFLQFQATAEVAHHEELKDWVEEQISTLVEWAFGKYDDEQGKWVTYGDHPIAKVARGDLLAEADRETTIETLIELLDKDEIDESTLEQAVRWLGRIAIGNNSAIQALVQLLAKHDDVHAETAESLFKIDPGNELAIEALVNLLAKEEYDSDNSSSCIVGRITLGILTGRCDIFTPRNRVAIQALENLLTKPELDDSVRWKAADRLGTIDPGNQVAIQVLVNLLNKQELDDSVRWKAADRLGTIDPGNQVAIQALVNLLNKQELDVNTRRKVAVILYTIEPGNELAIQSLVNLLNSHGIYALEYHIQEIDNQMRYRATSENLRKIGQGNELLIQSLVAVLTNPVLDEFTRSRVKDILCRIGQGNESVIQSLVALLANPELDRSSHVLAAGSLSKIGQGNEMVIQSLVALLANPELEEFARNQVAYSLSKIGQGNEVAICTLENLLTKPELDDSICWGAADTLGKINPGNQVAIQALTDLLTKPELDDSICWGAADTLGKINPGNQVAIQALVNLLTKPELDDSTRWRAADTLGKINPGNQVAIQALVNLLNKPELDDSTRWRAADTLGKINPGNQVAIQALENLLNSLEIYDWRVMPPEPWRDDPMEIIDNEIRWKATESLGEIDPGNELAIQFLVSLLGSPEIDPAPQLDCHIRSKAFDNLGRFDQGNALAIQTLTNLLANPEIDDETCWTAADLLEKLLEQATSDSLLRVVERLSRVERNFYVYNILWQCAQKLPYEGTQGFYAAWNHQLHSPNHPEAPDNQPVGRSTLTTTLERQTINLTTIQSELNRLHAETTILPVLIDCSRLTRITDSDTLAARLSNKIFEALSLEPPEVRTVADLERELLRLKSGKSHIAIGLWSQELPNNIQIFFQQEFGSSWLHLRHLSATTNEEIMSQINSWLAEL